MTRNSATVSPDPEQIAKVRDFLPQYGGGFIEKCLRYFGNNPDDVINAISENNLPPHLANLNTNLEMTEAKPNFEEDSTKCQY